MKQLKLPLFADELIEPEIAVCLELKIKGIRKVYYTVGLERINNSTTILISEVNTRNKKGRVLYRLLSEPGIFSLPFDCILSGLADLTQEQLTAFSKRVIGRQLISEFEMDAKSGYHRYAAPLNEEASAFQ